MGLTKFWFWSLVGLLNAFAWGRAFLAFCCQILVLMKKKLERSNYNNIQRLKLHVNQSENHTTAIDWLDYANEQGGGGSDKVAQLHLYTFFGSLSVVPLKKSFIAHVFPNPTRHTVGPHHPVVLLVVVVESIQMWSDGPDWNSNRSCCKKVVQ